MPILTLGVILNPGEHSMNVDYEHADLKAWSKFESVECKAMVYGYLHVRWMGARSVLNSLCPPRCVRSRYRLYALACFFFANSRGSSSLKAFPFVDQSRSALASGLPPHFSPICANWCLIASAPRAASMSEADAYCSTSTLAGTSCGTCLAPDAAAAGVVVVGGAVGHAVAGVSPSC